MIQVGGEEIHLWCLPPPAVLRENLIPTAQSIRPDVQMSVYEGRSNGDPMEICPVELTYLAQTQDLETHPPLLVQVRNYCRV